MPKQPATYHTPFLSKQSRALGGDFGVPGDKSISHRALILGSLAIGQTRIHGLLEGGDVMATAQIMRALGADIITSSDDDGHTVWDVWGCGVGGLREPDGVLDFANSGTGARLVMGLLAGHPFSAFMTGDASLRSRPMGRVFAPLTQMGANFTAHSGERLPAVITGRTEPLAIDYRLPVASAQIKSAILLAGLSATGLTRVRETDPSRDHSERMLRHFGATIDVDDTAGERVISLKGQPDLRGQSITIPGDPSSAAFPMVAALLCPGSHITLRNVGLNPLRIGLIDTLLEMGADITFLNKRESGGEPVTDIEVAYSELQAITVPASRAPSMIDEYPILAIAAASAKGTTVMHGLGELRHKESDRLEAMAQGLTACGVAVEAGTDYLCITGNPGAITGGATIASRLDHRIAMSFAVLGLVTKNPVRLDDATPIATSFPNFFDIMQTMGANLDVDVPQNLSVS